MSITDGKLVLSPDFKEFLQSLNANGVRYRVVGGYAVAMHGHPRYTKDFDLWIEPTLANGKRLVRALTDFGFASLGLSAEVFTQREQVIQLGYPPNRIDLLTDLVGVTFRACYRQRVLMAFDDIAIPVIDVESLKSNKRAAGRPQDLADADNLG